MLALNVFEYALPETVGLFIFRYIPRLCFPVKKQIAVVMQNYLD